MGPYNGYYWIVATHYARGAGHLWFEPWSTPGVRVQVWYADGTTDAVDATNGPSPPVALTAAFLGVTGEDYAGIEDQPANGIADWHIRLQGLRSTPVTIRISSHSQGVWISPFIGYWVVLPQYDGAGNADLWFEPWGAPGFHVEVWYSDGTKEEADTG